ncbi:PD-(D/E)XK nuclease family protein [Actinoplanes sp. LDG1-01]|uniref:PD-(D/E)XK nuclease family protein n=1 Tax=Paractinoplanes lichenicola TaxID=2802976 RepID=A0ABS1VX75_9ACTN|nr:PD-(D/E)XK nuclease family protein [Actinoplanes lichenicola]
MTVSPASPAEVQAPHAGPSLSPSRAADFKTCPLLFRFRTIDRLPEQPTADQVRGTLVHAVLESLFDLPAAERTPEAAAALVAPSWQRLLEQEPELSEIFAAATSSEIPGQTVLDGSAPVLDPVAASAGVALPADAGFAPVRAADPVGAAASAGLADPAAVAASAGSADPAAVAASAGSADPAAVAASAGLADPAAVAASAGLADPAAVAAEADATGGLSPGADEPARLAAFLAGAQALLPGYFAVEDPRRLEPAERETLVSTLVDDELLIRGYIDRLDVAPSGDLRVVDYKTGGAPREAFEGRALFQLKFYALVLWRTRGVVPRVLRLLYLKDAEVCDYSPDADELERFERTLVALSEAIERAKREQNFLPKPSRLCGWCSHQALCPAKGGTPPPYPSAPGVPLQVGPADDDRLA